MSGYIGTQPVPQATQTRDSFTATSGQTSFATGGYTPNFLDVYLNGVKLASADYTASNGSDVVLASGAALSDILEVVAYTAFDTANVTGATNFTVTGAFTSQGIDDNANATALTIDASENVLVGTTDSNVAFTNTVGIALKDGHAQMSQDGNGALYLNRKGTDGGTQYFHKDGTAVGGIGVSPDGPAFGTASQQVAFHANKLFPCQSYGSALDNTIDLGYSGSRFKDLYLSGDLYVNGQVKLANLASDPSDATTGGMYFNTTSGAVKVYDGSAWDQIQALTPFSTVNTRYQPHTQVNTQGAGAVKITSYGAAAWSAYDGGSGGGTYFGGHDGHNGNPTDYPAYVAVYLGGRHAVNRLNLALHGNHYGYFELQGSNNSGTGGSYDAGSWTSLPFITSNVSTQAQHAGGQYSGYSDGTVLTYQYNNDIAYSSYRLWIKDASQAGESLGTRYTGWATYYWELYRD